MALTADSFPETVARGVGSIIALNGTTIYAGALVAIDANGFATNWADTSGFVGLAGTALAQAIGDTSASPNVEVSLNTSGPIYAKVAVTGSTGQTDVGAKCYATDENTFNLSASTNVYAVGIVTRYYSGTTCDVRLFTPAEYVAQI